MTKLTPDCLEPGMRTAKSVVNSSGMVLLGENTELTAELIRRIRDMGIDAIFVHGSSKPAVAREAAFDELEKRFAHIPDTPPMTLIKNAILRHMASLYE